MTTVDENFFKQYPEPLIRALGRLAGRCSGRFYIAGGPVRDWLLGKESHDLDITLPAGSFECGRELSRQLKGAFVPLDEKEDVARVVWQGYNIDFSAFREGAASIEADLLKRDFSVNALAVPFEPERFATEGIQPGLEVIDPAGGIVDLRAGVIRCTSAAVFENDPLRMLRAYRFMAGLGFAIDPATEESISAQAENILRAAPERLAYELELIMVSDRAAEAIGRMYENGLLGRLFPELLQGVGVQQPDSHHLDVFEHGLATLEKMAVVQEQPEKYFPGHGRVLRQYLDRDRKLWLRWAALFHDLGKPGTFKIREEKAGRITFYNHDGFGAHMFEGIAARFKWSRKDTMQVGRFIARHMWPFHLNNARRRTGLTARAFLRLAKTMGEELPGLFLLAMADSLAGRGAGKPPAMEMELAGLYAEAARAYEEKIRPVLETPRLIDGNDLMQRFGLRPGPGFREIFNGLEKARVAGKVANRDQALKWVADFLDNL